MQISSSRRFWDMKGRYSGIVWPKSPRLSRRRPNVRLGCFLLVRFDLSVSLSVIIRCQSWPFSIRIRTYVPKMDGSCLSMCHLWVCPHLSVCYGHLRSVLEPASPQWTSLVFHLLVCLSSSIVSCGHLWSVSKPASQRWTSLVYHPSVCLSSSIVSCGHLWSISIPLSPQRT